MKKLTTQSGTFGPYHNIEVLSDRYRCDGADLPFVVVGDGVISDVQEGDFPAPEPTPEPVPSSVTMRQARLALHAHGKLTAVQDAINLLSAPSKTEAQIEWDYASVVERNSPFVTMLTPMLAMTEGEMDDLFREANKL